MNKHTKRDLSQAQFEEKATKLGFKKGFFMGYWQLASVPSMNVSVWNAGKRNRDRLRYLIAEDKRAAKHREIHPHGLCLSDKTVTEIITSPSGYKQEITHCVHCKCKMSKPVKRQ